MTSKNPKDLTRAVARASKVLRDAGLDVKHTQMLSAIAAFQGFSNREEFLAVAKTASQQPAPADVAALQRDLAYYKGIAEKYVERQLAAEPQPAGLMPQLELVRRVTEVLDRLADGEDFNDVCERTGISAIVSQQKVLLEGKTIAGEPAKAETFIERLQKMSPAELTHADFQLVLGALKRAFKDIEQKLGYTPSWMYPFVNIASSLESDAQRAILDRAFPYQVVSYASLADFRGGYGEKLVLVQDLAEGIAEMRKRLDENEHLFGLALVSRDGSHRYTTLVRGLDGNYRHDPDGLDSQISGQWWDDLAHEVKQAGTFPGCGQFFGGAQLEMAVQALEERICRRRGHVPAADALEWLGLTVGKAGVTCEQLHTRIRECLEQMQDHFAHDQVTG